VGILEGGQQVRWRGGLLSKEDVQMFERVEREGRGVMRTGVVLE
jgi:hypothetical protein